MADRDNSNRHRIPISTFLRHSATYLLLIIGVIIAVFPFYWMISTSLMTLGDAQGTRFNPRLNPFRKLCSGMATGEILLIPLEQHPDHVDYIGRRVGMQYPGSLCVLQDQIPGTGFDLYYFTQHHDDTCHGDHHPQLPDRYLAGTDRPA